MPENNKSQKQSFFQVTLRLFLICVIASAGLGIVNAITGPIIEKNKAANLKNALESFSKFGNIGTELKLSEKHLQLFKNAAPESKTTIQSYFCFTDTNQTRTGYLLKMAGKGFAGEIILLAAYDTNGTILSSKLVSHNETIDKSQLAQTDPRYMQQFNGTGNTPQVPTRKNQLSNPDIVSGATYTFRGIARSLTAGSLLVREVFPQ